MLNDALKYAKRGIAVFPLSPGSKIPLKGTSGVKEATTDQDKIKTWWLHNPKANVGVAMGAISGIVGVDLDTNHGASPEDRQRFPRTVTVRSRNGYHLFFKYPVGGIDSQEVIKGRTVGDDESAAYLRSDGYYFVGRGSTVSWDKALGQLPPFDYEFDSDAGGSLSFEDCPLADFPVELLTAKTPKAHHQAAGSGPDKKVYGPNTRHAMFTRTATAMRKRGEPAEKIAEELHKRNSKDCNPPKDGIAEEIDGIVKWAMENVEVKVSNPVGRPPKGPDGSPLALAEEFLLDVGFADEDGQYLRYWRGEFYRYKVDHYGRIEDEKLEEEINNWLRGTNRGELAGGKKVPQMISCLKMRPAFIDHNSPVPCFTDGRPHLGIIPFKNGLLDLRSHINGVTELQRHTSDFFSTYVLPFEFKPEAGCPIYDKVASEAFGDPVKKALWEEILGIHVFQPFPIEYFFVLQGEGSNGKSVLATVLRCLLGSDNCSAIPLESFHPDNFSFGATQGKLANIVSDQHDIDNTNEGLIKQFVTREPMTFNRKFKEPYTARPTAFLTVCCNQVPRFQDKSDGLWRRLILFQFKNQVATEQQDKRLIDPDFWNASGELSGVFNLALKGLARVIERGRLEIPPDMKLGAFEYRVDLNTIAQFAQECLKPEDAGREPSSAVYQSYRSHTLAQGMKPVNARTFANRLPIEIKKVHRSKAELSAQNERINSYSGRVWHGLKLTNNAPNNQPLFTGENNPQGW